MGGSEVFGRAGHGRAASKPARRFLSPILWRGGRQPLVGRFCAYATNYLIDTKHAIILDVEATPAYRTSEVESARTMVERVEQRLELRPERLIGHRLWHGANAGLDGGREADRPHVPVWDKTARTDDSVSSPEFEGMKRTTSIAVRRGIRYGANGGRSRHPEATLQKLTPSSIGPANRSARHARSRTAVARTRLPERSLAACMNRPAMSPGGLAPRPQRQSRRERNKVEMLFAHLKRILKLQRLRLGGMTGACDEFTLAAIAHKLRRLPDQPLFAGNSRSPHAYRRPNERSIVGLHFLPLHVSRAGTLAPTSECHSWAVNERPAFVHAMRCRLRREMS
jgi:hypothetical protein